MHKHYPNPNILWANILLEELSRLGVEDICLAPGSRSTPLVLAAAENPKLDKHLHFDERGLGFFALGMAKAKNKPTVIVTTSGTAVANLYPALIEASLTNVPLIILSADRPAELIDCGANQAINQTGIFAQYPVSAVNLPAPDLHIPAAFLLTSIDQAVNQQALTPGPIHINCPYREPLYPGLNLHNYSEYLAPVSAWCSGETCYSQYHNKQTALTTSLNWPQISRQKGLIICGQTENCDMVAQFASELGWPLLADIQSGLKGHPYPLHYYDILLNNADYKAVLEQADIIIQFGARLISKRLLGFIRNFSGPYWLIDKSTPRLDPAHIVKQRFVATTDDWLRLHQADKYNPWGEELIKADEQIDHWLHDTDQGLTELSVTRALPRLLPDNSHLFLGNSMPVRLLDMFGEQNSKQQSIYTNRGASGIDGLLATATGVAKANPERPLTLLLGDTSLLHDLNSMPLLKQLSSAMIIIVLNNDGGAIFNLLPVPEQVKADYYRLPHGLNFKAACELFEIPYLNPISQQEFELDYTSCLTFSGASLLEIKTPADETTELVKSIGKRIGELTLF